MNRIPKLLRNKFFLTGTVFLVWMVFFDKNNLFSQVRLRRQLGDIRGKVEFYKRKTEEARQERNDLFSDDRKLEKFARERFMMKRPGEDVFVVIPDSAGNK